MRIGNLDISFRGNHKVRDRSDATASTFLKSINYIGSRFAFQKYQFRNYTADQQIQKGYIQSSLGSACVSRYEVAYPEPNKVALYNGEISDDKSLTSLIRKPNQWMSEMDFDRYMIKYQLMTGNCYFIKDRGTKYGELKALFPFSDLNVNPVASSSNFIDHYNFFTFDGEKIEYAPEDIVHIPWMYINPLYPNKGISPGALAAREIDTDTEFGRHIASFVYNNAEPGGIIEVAKDAVAGATGVGESTAKKIAESFRSRFGGKGNGLPAILQPGFTYKQIGTNLKDLDLQYARATQEARTCALYLIPPEEVGVNVGLAHSTENNIEMSTIKWTNRTLIPLWKQNAKKLSVGLQFDYPGVDIEYDIAGVESVKTQRQKTVLDNSTALKSWLESYWTGKMERTAAISGAKYTFGFTDEFAAELFPEKTETNLVVTDAGVIA